MPTPLDYERFGLSQDRYARQGDQFDANMDFRRMVDERNFGYRTERDDTMMDWRRQQAAQAERLALLRMLPQGQRMQAIAGPRMSGPARAAAEYQESLDNQNANNFAAVPSWQAERDRSNFATETGMDLRNYAAQQQAGQMARLQQRQAVVDGPMDALAQQRAADEAAAKRKAVLDDAMRFGKFYGANPADLVNNYDEKTGISTIPGDYTVNQGKFIQKPGRQVKLDPGHLAAMRGVMTPEEKAEEAIEPQGNSGPSYGFIGNMAARGGQWLAQQPIVPNNEPPNPSKDRIMSVIKDARFNRRIMPQAIQSALKEMEQRQGWTEADLLAAMERHDAAFFQRNLTHPESPTKEDFYWARSQAAKRAIDQQEARQRMRGWTPIVSP